MFKWIFIFWILDFTDKPKNIKNQQKIPKYILRKKYNLNFPINHDIFFYTLADTPYWIDLKEIIQFQQQLDEHCPMRAVHQMRNCNYIHIYEQPQKHKNQKQNKYEIQPITLK